MSAKFTKPSKLCKRTYFLRTMDSVPTQSQMRQELEHNLADVILKLMSPACQQWMGVDRKLKGPTIYCVDADELKGTIHEHILRLGKEAEDKLAIKRKRVVKRNKHNEEVDFIKFECRQKIEIAREEEQRKMQEELKHAVAELENKYDKMKAELGEDYLRARKHMAEFICKNLRKQASNLIRMIAQQYRIHLEKEICRRVNAEVQRMAEQVNEVVRAAVEHQKEVDTKAMQKMSLRYEELIRNLEHCEAYRTLTELSQRICSRWTTLCGCIENQETSCQTSFINQEYVSHKSEANSPDIASEANFVGSCGYMEEDDIFVVEPCFMTPGPSPIYSASESSIESLPATSSSETIFDQYNQFHCKIREQLSLLPMISWAPYDQIEQTSYQPIETPVIDSNFTRDVVNGILAKENLSEEEIQIAKVDYECAAIAENYKSSTTATESAISDLFNLNKSNATIDLLINGITLKYVRAQGRDYE
ncbi:uncharacterized protein LOC128740308 [Sabethes cyaneus]|uniref:uncharacterized protein LOC128740308 n=1 Tax=Sabethes cyaneus TaxID=53552 RepID=UPI00237DD11E|nr:uncharacterized protein LOC128740308 [Sabethes cyaneus]